MIARAFTGWLDKSLRDISRRNIVKRYQEIQEGIARRKKQPEKANPRGLAEAQKAMRYLSAIMNSNANDRPSGVCLSKIISMVWKNIQTVLLRSIEEITLNANDSKAH